MNNSANNKNKAIPPQVKVVYEKAKDAVQSKNYDYAIQLLTGALRLKADFVDGRDLLRLAERKREQEIPVPVINAVFNKLKLFLPLVKGPFLELKNPISASFEYEKGLRYAPRNRYLLARVAGCLRKAGMLPAAAKVFEDITLIDKKNAAAFKAKGEIYSQLEDYDKARSSFEAAETLTPEDVQLGKGLKKVDALSSIQKGKWEDQKSYRTKIKDIEEAEVLEKEDRIVRTESDIEILIKENAEKLKSNPDNLDILRTLGDLYFRKEEFDRSIEIYGRVLLLDPKNLAIQRRLAQAKLKKLDFRIQDLKQELSDKPEEPGIISQLKELEKEKKTFRLEEMKKSVSQYPNDLALRFDYGMLLKELGSVDEAIGHFQLSVNDPARRSRSLNMLGLCFEEKGMHDLALAQFKKALEKLLSLNEEKKEIIYNLGSVYERMGDAGEAINEYKKIFEVDISYRDVAQKVSQAYQKSHPERPR